MSRLWFALVIVTPMLGCSTFRQQQAANCSCESQLCDNGECSDCLPPKVAGTYFYHEHVDWLVTKGTAQKCANRDLKFFDDYGDLTKDFRDGYTQAYIDLALGRPACVPAVPPKKYWHAWHRSCGGHDAVEQWYAGYRNGLDNGLNSGVSRFNRIVGNPESCCVSAAYVSPYAGSNLPETVQPPGSQTISDVPMTEEAETMAEGLEEPATAEPISTLIEPAYAFPVSYPSGLPINR